MPEEGQLDLLDPWHNQVSQSRLREGVQACYEPALTAISLGALLAEDPLALVGYRASAFEGYCHPEQGLR